MNLEEERDELRKRWRMARERRLALKQEMMERGTGLESIRKDKEYRKLKKEQARLSVLIKHIEKKINRMRVSNSGKEKK